MRNTLAIPFTWLKEKMSGINRISIGNISSHPIVPQEKNMR